MPTRPRLIEEITTEVVRVIRRRYLVDRPSLPPLAVVETTGELIPDSQPKPALAACRVLPFPARRSA